MARDGARPRDRVFRTTSENRSIGRLLLVVGVVGAAATVTFAAVRTSAEPAPADKQALLDHEQNRRDALPNDATRKPTRPPAGPPAQPEPPPLTGILELNETPFPKGLFAIENRWQAFDGHTVLQVFAGALASDPDQGVVVLRRIAWPSGRELFVEEHPTPARDGTARLESARRHRLTVATGTRELVFDADAGAFTP